MDAKDIIVLVLALFGAVGGIVGSYSTLRGIKPKSLLDDSSAAGNFQKVVLDLQKEVQDLRDKMDGKQLKIHMTVEIDKAPIVDQWEWISTNDADTKQLPRRTTGGLGIRK